MHPEFYEVSLKKRNQLEDHGVQRKIIYLLICLDEIAVSTGIDYMPL
jgi:hypothetical protein